jgi:imidazoleglycerol-phosphate dehydratase/histidinol-phosphatase
MKRRVIFIDRDGTIIKEPPDTRQVDSLERLSFVPGAIGALRDICRDTGYELVMVTNQDGLGTSSFPEETFIPAHQKMLEVLAGEGIEFSEVLIDRSFPQEGLETRKPGIGLLKKYLGEEYDVTRSFVIGDRETDLQLAINLGARGIFLGADFKEMAVFSTTSWSEIARFVRGQWRAATVRRVTRETSIALDLCVIGSGRCAIRTGVGFFDHMLELMANHAGFDLSIDATGDLHVDEHHLVEDVGLVLGEAVRVALGDKRAIRRFGFVLPMDESLADVAIDLSNRNRFVWNGSFQREKLGTFPTELIPHFFESFAEALRCALHISVKGDNEHHKAEAMFKGLGRALRDACSLGDAGQGIPSTKGAL